MARSDTKPPSQRMLRVGELVRHALAEALARGEVVDPGLKGRVVTVPEVRMSPDLKLATAYVMPLGGVGEAEVLEALKRQAKPLRGAVGRRLNGMRVVPELRFRRDERFDEAARIDRLLRDPRVVRDLAAPAPGEPEDEPEVDGPAGGAPGGAR